MISKGEEAELLFKSWLDDSGLGYLYIKQDQECFAQLFKGHVKRPDFIVLIDSLGLIAVDVKHKEPYKECYSMDFDKEVMPAMNFERLFRLPVWYAYYDKKNSLWSWISALKALNIGGADKRINSNDKSVFMAIKKEEFVEIAGNEDLGKLYTQRVSNESFGHLINASQ